MPAVSKPILCLDFDGVLHSYSSGWKGADVIPDPPTDGAMRFIWDAADHFTIAIFSSRSRQTGGHHAMLRWLEKHFREHWASDRTRCDDILAEIQWPMEKPPAMVTIDDRALTFTGNWADFDMDTLKAFQPWNKRPQLGATGDFPRGKFNADDEGALTVGVATQDKTVLVNFGKPVAWLGMPKADAIAFANTIIQHAGKL